MEKINLIFAFPHYRVPLMEWLVKFISVGKFMWRIVNPKRTFDFANERRKRQKNDFKNLLMSWLIAVVLFCEFSTENALLILLTLRRKRRRRS